MDSAGVIHGDHLNPSDLRARLGAAISYDTLVANFRLPDFEFYNMAADTVDRQARGANAGATALTVDDGRGAARDYSFAELSRLSDRFAGFLRGRGLGQGDVIVCYCAQGLETALAHLSAYKLGAVVAPLSQLYGPDSVAHALRDCAPKAVVTQAHLWPRIAAVCEDCAELKLVVVSGESAPPCIAFDEALQSGDGSFEAARTRAEDPALLLYTSGSTGMPKGILHRQRILQGYLASVSLFYELQMNEPDQVLWTASDWSWVAGIFNVMLTGWYFGQRVVASDGRFEPEWCFDLMARHGVTHCFLTPTALKRLATFEDPKDRWPDLSLRAIGTGGEPLPSAVLEWGARSLAVPINEFYGLTEVNHLIGNCRRLWPIKPGSMGRPYPGHTIGVIDEKGVPLADGTLGEIAARDDDPTLFLGYWKQPGRTAAMRCGRWVRTGDFGYRDEDGYFWYEGRNDDLIKSSGYRIGPAEVEDTLVAHPAVNEAAVVGIPDEARGQLVKAFVRLNAGHNAGLELAEALKAFVKQRLAAYKYPREVEFLETFPLTSTGKINRKALRRREEMKFEEARSKGSQDPAINF